MSEDTGGQPAPPPDSPAPEIAQRPIDLGLSEGKSLTFSPTAVAIPAEAPMIGGTTPSEPPPVQMVAPQDAPAAPPPPPAAE